MKMSKEIRASIARRVAANFAAVAAAKAAKEKLDAKEDK